MLHLACFDLIDKPFSSHIIQDPRVKFAFTIKSFKDQRSKELWLKSNILYYNFVRLYCIFSIFLGMYQLTSTPVSKHRKKYKMQKGKMCAPAWNQSVCVFVVDSIFLAPTTHFIPN